MILCLLVVWAAFGFGVNRFLESRKSNLTEARSTVVPPQETPAFSLPGVIYVSQAGHLYRFDAGHFTDMKLPASPGAWMQPAPAGGGMLLAVARADNSSDVYLIDGTTGAVVRKLTANATRTKFVELNAWSYFPRLAADGKTVISNYDGPKTGASYEVDFAVWAGPLSGNLASKRWTTPNGYTGGDVGPVPTPSGGVIYAKYALDSSSKVLSRIVSVARPGATPVYLTAAADDCNEPALSPDGTALAVVCTADTQTAKLELFPLVNGVPGTPRVLVDSCLCASPAWSPDGSGLLYLAPADASGHFQLWWLNHATSIAQSPAKVVTTHLDLDATSPPAWVAA